MAEMDIDFGKAAADYGKHRAGFPDAFFERLFALGFVRPGNTALDLGTGTGTLARGLAMRSCRVIGLDPSDRLIEEAKRLDKQRNVKVEYLTGRAEQTNLQANAFDVVTAGQCWHWFDRSRAATEARRVLKPGGYLIIAHFDWLPLPDNVVEATEQLILKHNPGWQGGAANGGSGAGGLGIHPLWLRDVAIAGFTSIETFSFDVDVEYSHEAWRGRIRASAGIAASLPPQAVSKFDAELAELLFREFPLNPLQIPHRVWAVVCRSPAGSPAY